MATLTMHSEEYDEDYEEERVIEQRATLDEEDRLLHHSSWKKKSPSIDRYSSTSIDTQPHQPNHLRASTDNGYLPSIDTNVDATRDKDYSIGSWADDRYHESYAVETVYRDQRDDDLHEGFTYDHPIDRESRPSIDINHSTSIDINNTTSIDIRPIPKTTVNEKDKFDNQYLTPDEFGILRDPDGYARAIDGRTLHVSREDIADILQTANGADNLLIHQRNIPEHQQKATKEFYDTAGCIDKSFKQRTRHPTQPSIDVDVPTSVDRLHEFGRRAFDLLGTRRFYWEEKDEDIRRLLERASRDEPAYISLQQHASSFTQPKLVPEIYTKDENNEMFYEVCGEQEKNKEVFQMKLDGVYYPLNDSISWMTTCMEEMKKDVARIQRATDVARPTSIDIHLHKSIDSRLHTSIDNHIPASVDDNPPHPHSIKSEIDHISYIARRSEASPSIDRRNNKSTDIHQQISVDKASNRGRLVQKITSDMSDTHNHGEEISADTYARLMRHQFNLESLGDRLQKIEDATTIMKDKWRIRDEAMRELHWSDLEINDDFGAFWRYLEQPPEMTIELDHQSILEEEYRSMFTLEHRSTAKRAESPFGHSRLEDQVFTNLQDYP
ncbi:hypothetical protein F2Q69_00035100 [Brassica cretica]|uniref:Uncharacterized protein n=1 Tax=Brassica cretica TaxID=69181 RepID=A0A8S9SGT5_BRACR|nr:hypothetical protein F2Q69_00035100 [Brassica cretica]